jgi:hypothetical protein
MGAIKPHRSCNDKASDVRLQQALNHRKKFSFLESHMRRQALAEAAQRFTVTLPQPIEQRAQLLVICQCTLCKRLHFHAGQERQQRLFLNLKMRFQLIGEHPDYTLTDFSHQRLIV